MAMLWSLAWFESSISAFAVAIDATMQLQDFVANEPQAGLAYLRFGCHARRFLRHHQYVGRSDGCKSHCRATSRAISRGSAFGPPVMFQV